MLCEARRRRDRGTDVVVGVVETHGREKTAELLDGLEILPRRHTRVGDELDVQAVLDRRPEVVLVDELAHTNPPDSRYAKRWQDVEEILAAGIDVLSTVNVQHLESLNDVVEKITGVRQRETVPDEFVRRADQIELVDITPEALRRRLAHGNVYAAEKVDAALANYFQVGNLIALRELALLWVADEVDVAMRRHRTEQHISETWETRERVVVALTGGPESETVLRRATRIAKRAGQADLLAVHVLRGDGLAGAPVGATNALKKLADDVGATFHTVVGDSGATGVTDALLEFARAVNATQLVLGTSRRSRLARLFDEGIGARVVQESGSIDVHMVTHSAAGAAALRIPRLRSAVPVNRRILGWVLAVLGPATATLLGSSLHQVVGVSTDVVLFFLATIVAAIVGGLGPALLAALLSGLLLNFFLTPPLYSLTISEPENIVTVVAMLLVAVLVALVVDRAARRGEQAARARTEAALLASFARTVLTRADPLPRLLEEVREAFGLRCVALLEHTNGHWNRVAVSGPPECTRPEDADVDVAVEPGLHLIGTGRNLPAHDRRLLETVGGQALLALRGQRAAEEAQRAQHRAEVNETRGALLSAVGHDLRSPLTSIKASVGSLRDPVLRLSGTDRAELLETVEESADRLTGLVDNLLDSSRLASGVVEPLLERVGYDEIAARALIGLPEADRVALEIPAEHPDVVADIGLLERVVANLVDNALRHGCGAPVVLRASTHEGRAELRVVDSGPGVPKKQREKLFAPFQRLGDRRTSRIGLGLSVAHGLTEVMGGTLTAEDTPGGGLTTVLSLPLAVQTGATPVSARKVSW
jgi:two-component system sensor histidine kinase KdpD